MLVSPKSTSLLTTFHNGSMFCFFPANFMASTNTDKNNPFWRCTKRHSQLDTFSQPYFKRIFSNYLSHNNPAKGWQKHISLNWNDWIFHTVCVSVDVSKYLDILTSYFWQRWCIFNFDLGVSRYCICRLSCASWWPWCNVHHICSRHLWSWWCKYCVWSWVILHNVTSEYDSAFVILKLWFQTQIFEMTDVG